MSLTYKFGGKKPTGITKSSFTGLKIMEGLRSRSERPAFLSMLSRFLARLFQSLALSGLQRETVTHCALPGTEDCGSRADSPRF